MGARKDFRESLLEYAEVSAEALENLAERAREWPSDTALIAAMVFGATACDHRDDREMVRATIRAVEMARLIIYFAGDSNPARCVADFVDLMPEIRP